MSDFKIIADLREDLGKGASRRLRRVGKVPAIVYGGGKTKKPASITIQFKELTKFAENEAFFSSLIDLEVNGKAEQVILMDLQRHPARADIMHVDFERVSKSTIIHKTIPLHFLNENSTKAVKLEGGKVQHTVTEVAIECKASALPEFIEVDLADVKLGTILHLSDLNVPKGVTLVALKHDDDKAVCSIIRKGGGDVDADAEEASEE